MIKVLQNWLEIGEAGKFLAKKFLPAYPGGEKNWDLYNLYKIVESMPRGAKIVDLGCGGLMALKFLYAMGFKNLSGINLTISLKDRLSQLARMLRSRLMRVPFHLFKGDITKTKFFNNSFDLVVCTSVLEHGVNLEQFLIESKRILKHQGLLFISVDYWKDEIQADKEKQPFGLPHKVFSKKNIEDFIELAKTFGFSLYEDSSIPQTQSKCIFWNKKEYTFLSMVFVNKDW